MDQYWTEEEKAALHRVRDFGEAADLSIRALSRMSASGREVVQICGPMSTGGRGSFTANMAFFRQVVARATEAGVLVFDQTKIQPTIIRLCGFADDRKRYYWEILEGFYRPVFNSGHIHRTLYLPDWETSVGTCWEYGLALRLNIPVEDCPSEWLT